MAKCKSCGASIIWIGMRSGRSMPCNAEQVTYWKDAKGKDTIITPNGETVRANLSGDLESATGIGYISHWATCPQSFIFRKREGSNGRE